MAKVKTSRRLVVLIFSVLIIDGVIGSLVYPVFPEFTKSSKHPALWFQLGVALFALMQFVCAPLLGKLSDRFGRRPVFRVAAIGTLVSLTLLFPVRLGLFIANRGADGSTNGLYAVVRSAIVDVSKPEDVQKNIGLSVSLSYVGFAVGPGVAFLVLKLADWGGWNDVRAIVVAGGFFAVFNVFLSFFIPETRPERVTGEAVGLDSDTFSLRSTLGDANPMVLVRRLSQLRRTQPMIARVLLTETLVALSISYYTYFVIFVHESPLQLDANAIAELFVYFSVLGFIVNTVFFGYIVKRINVISTMRVLIGIGVVVIGLYATIGYSNVVLLYVALTVDMATFSLVPGLAEGVVGKLADEQARGELFGISQGLAALAGVIGALSAAPLAFVDLRLPFVLFGIAAFAAFVVSLSLGRMPPDDDWRSHETSRPQLDDAAPYGGVAAQIP
jgi:MFS transporter, DHA1 family, tetracycline resistance protein